MAEASCELAGLPAPIIPGKDLTQPPSSSMRALWECLEAVEPAFPDLSEQDEAGHPSTAGPPSEAETAAAGIMLDLHPPPPGQQMKNIITMRKQTPLHQL